MTNYLRILFCGLVIAISNSLNAQIISSPDNLVSAILGGATEIPKSSTTDQNGWTNTNSHWAAPLIYRTQRFPNDGSGNFPFNEYGELMIQGTSYGSSYNKGISFVTWDGTNNSPDIRLRINDSGNVGIGTVNPFGNLHIRNSGDGADQYSGIRFNAAKSASEATLATHNYHVISGFRRNGLWIAGGSTGSSYSKSNVMFTDGGIQFGMSDGYINPEDNIALTILNNGSIGIGTENPCADCQLDVDGKIRSEEVVVEVVNGPDYVFEDDYDLRTLEETKDYIEQNKHLPEIPSAKEMEASGVGLAEMNMKLLQKIEELTLHLIEQHTTLKNQSEEIQSLKDKVAKLENGQ